MSQADTETGTNEILSGMASDYLETGTPDILSRWGRHLQFWDDRLAAGLDPYFRTSTSRIGPECAVATRGQQSLAGVNFGSQDYLSLASHPTVTEAAVEAIGRWGVHSAGSIGLQGATPPFVQLEERLAELFSCREVTAFPTGWAAGYGVVRALVRDTDHIVLDIVAHACLREGAEAATRNIHRVPNCSVESVRQRLARIRERDPHAGILVITESLFSMDSTVPDLRAMQDVCHDYRARLLVDVAHDFGSIGDGGLGFLGEQGMIGEVDLVMGSFSKTFASNGGFVASSATGIKQALRAFAGPLLFSNALSPVQAAIVNAALSIVRSREGAERRARLMRNVMRLRTGLGARAFRLFGQPSAIVPVWLGSTTEARLMTRAALAAGALVNLVEHPVVARNNTRWRLQVMADHSEQQIDRLIAVATEVREAVSGPTALSIAVPFDEEIAAASPSQPSQA